MKNEKIIHAWDKMKPSSEMKTEIYEEIIRKQNVKRVKSKIPAKILAMAAALVLIVGLVNIQTVWAFVRELFFVPGVGFTDSDVSVAMLERPIKINTDLGEITIEFATKVKYDDGQCEILLYFTSTNKEVFDEFSEESSNSDYDAYIEYKKQFTGEAFINGENHILDVSGFSASRNKNHYIGQFNLVSNDFPDVNEFDLQFRDMTTHIVLTELTEDEKIPYTSEEINGISFAVYKYRNNNRLISIDAVNNNDLGEFHTGSPSIVFSAVTGEQNIELPYLFGAIYGFRNRIADEERGFGYSIAHLDNEANIELKSIDMKPCPGIQIEYFAELEQLGEDLSSLISKPNITLPIPKDGETIKTDIKMPVGGTVYEVTEVRREGNIIYYEDNSIYNKIRNSGEGFDVDSAVQNNKVYIMQMNPLGLGHPNALKIDLNDNSITGFNPENNSFDINIRSIEIIYFGDFSIDLTAK